MYTITVAEGEDGQRLDRFLKKYLRAAPLSLIYRLIRKDVKVGGNRVESGYMLEAGDEITLYLQEDRIKELSFDQREGRFAQGAKRSFGIVDEDENILVTSKPFGLLTHGDKSEKKETLANQVIAYLLEKKEYDPSSGTMFTPSPVNRLDRNTTGIVVFGKVPKAVRDFNKMFAASGCVEKYYLTIVGGRLEKELLLKDRILKDEEKNRVSVLPENGKSGKAAETRAKPIEYLGSFTLVSIRLVTGRPHQIRAHLAEAGHPVIGDVKYGDKALNERVAKKYGLKAQFLHANRLKVVNGLNTLEYLSGREFISPLPGKLEEVCEAIRNVNGKVN